MTDIETETSEKQRESAPDEPTTTYKVASFLVLAIPSVEVSSL